ACPWCPIGLKSLEEAIARVSPSIQADIHFEPFEINPTMAKEGEDIDEHLVRKYGGKPADFVSGRDALRQRGQQVGFTFGFTRKRIYNTFDAHRLLHWAGTKDSATQHTLKMTLFTDYFTHGKDPSSEAVLVDAAVAAGLDAQEARRVLSTGQYATDVKRAEAKWRAMGINSVPAIIINDTHLISGGQPADVFEQALRDVASV
ncbi:hypothetical protein As57867_009740, partial [Aphanomyces stellatus]